MADEVIEFEIPDLATLPRFTVAALKDMQLDAAATFDALRASLTEENVTEQDLDDLEDLKSFMSAVDEELTDRKSRSGRFAALTKGKAKGKKDMEDEEDAADGGADESEEGEAEGEDEAEASTKTERRTRFAAVTASASGKEKGNVVTGEVVPSIAQVAAVAPTPVVIDRLGEVENKPQFSILAGADTGYPNGAKLDDWLDVAKAFIARSHTHSGGTAQQSMVATIKREFTNDMAISDGDDDISVMRKIDFARDETKLPGGSLLAGAGWCAPSEVIYTTCNAITTDGLLNLPEIGARRGGVRHNQGIQFDTIFGTGTGFNILTEAQVISDTTKTCAAIPCPSFVDDRLKVSALCLTGDILQNRGYPEFVSEFVQGAIASQAHNVNRQIIADISADSTAVNLGSGIWTSDGSTLSAVMSAAEMAAMDIKYRLRMQRNATIEMVFPYWLRSNIRADYIRRNAAPTLSLSDAEIDSLLAERGVRAQWVYDWQDAFTSTGVSGTSWPGADSAIGDTPSFFSFLAYPAGTWVVARQDVIRLDTIYDSTNLATNKVTQLFLEDGFRAMRFCPISRVYTAPICHNGRTGATASITC
jgi:hypothetical protein